MKTPFPGWKRGFLRGGPAYIPFFGPGNCQLVNSARWGPQRLRETETSTKRPKSAFLVPPGHYGLRLGVELPDSAVGEWDLLSFFRVRYCRKFAQMIANSVRLSEVLRQMEEGEERFSIRFVKADKRRKTGGQILEWQNCQLSKRRVVGSRRPPAAADGPTAPSNRPAHYANATRNVVQGNSSQVRKVHIWLLLAFNGQRVVLG